MNADPQRSRLGARAPRRRAAAGGGRDVGIARRRALDRVEHARGVAHRARVTASSTVSPEMLSPISGPSEIRWRVGLSPNEAAVTLAGIRIEPPPSLAWAIGTMPEATAAAEPPLEPPVVRSVSQGLRVGAVGVAARSSAGCPSSGVLVLPIVTKPAARKRCAEVGVDRSAEVRLLEQPSCRGAAAGRRAPRRGP